MPSKREQIRTLLNDPHQHLTKAEIARRVGVSYQTVRNVEQSYQRDTELMTRTWDERNLTTNRNKG
jgi:DNA-binding XRE family transcriptional regulator